VTREPPAASPAAPGRYRPSAAAAATGRHHDVRRHREKEEMQQAGPTGGGVGGNGRPRGKDGRSSASTTSGRPGPARRRRRRWRRWRRRRRRRCLRRRRGGGCRGGSGHPPHRHCQGHPTPALSVVPWRPWPKSGAVTLCELRLCWTNQIVEVTLGSTLTGPSQGCDFPSCPAVTHSAQQTESLKGSRDCARFSTNDLQHRTKLHEKSVQLRTIQI